MPEKKLRQQIELTRAITNSLGEGVCAIDLEGRLTFMNPAAEQMLGWKESEIIGQDMHDLIHFQREDGTAIPVEECEVLAVMRQRESVTDRDDLFTRRDGTMFPISYTSSPIVTEGQVTGAVVSFRDITRRRQAERRLVAQYATTRILAESTTIDDAATQILEAICESLQWALGALWIVDAEADSIRCVKIWHAPSSSGVPEFVALSQQTVFKPGEGLPGRVWQSGEPTWIADVTVNGNFPRAHAAAREGLHGACGFPILTGGRILGVMEFFSRELRGVDEDLLRMMSAIGSQTGQFIERTRAESLLRESEERYRIVAETASDAIITIDEESTILFLNRAAEKIFGHAAAEMIGSELTMLMPDYLRHLHRAGFGRYLETGRKHISWEGVELPGLHKDGREIPLEVSFGEFSKNGRHIFTGIVRDITERKRAEEEQAERARLAALGADVGVALTQGDTLQEILQSCAEALVRHLDGAFARVWTPNEAGDVLELQASAGMYTHLDGAHARVPVGLFKIGLIAEERRPHLTNSVVGDARVSEQEWAKREGMVAFAGYPLIVDERLVGVMAMFARRALTQATLDAMASVANIVAVGVERKRAEAVLREQKDTLLRLNEERGRMLEEVSTPVVPVWQGVLVLPIIGSLDTERMKRATEAALGEVVRTGAHACIIDITAARLVDSHAVANLGHLVASLRLVGAEAIVTGVTAQAARSLVNLGVDFAGLRTRRTLAEALATLIKSSPQTNKDGFLSNGTTS